MNELDIHANSLVVSKEINKVFVNISPALIESVFLCSSHGISQIEHLVVFLLLFISVFSLIIRYTCIWLCEYHTVFKLSTVDFNADFTGELQRVQWNVWLTLFFLSRILHQIGVSWSALELKQVDGLNKAAQIFKAIISSIKRGFI